MGGALVPRDVAAYEASLFGRAPLFLAGIAAAAVYRTYGGRIRQRLDRARLMRDGRSDLLLVLLVLGIAAFARCEQALGYRALSTPHYQYRDLVTAALLAALLLLLVPAPLRLKRLLVNPLWEGLGVVSDSVYLVHVPQTMFLLASRPFDQSSGRLRMFPSRRS